MYSTVMFFTLLALLLMQTKTIYGRIFFGRLILMGVVQGMQVDLKPLYPDPRFQPSDKLHAECISSADIVISPQGKSFSKITLILGYNPETLEIIRILPTEPNGSATSKIEYNRIVLEIQHPTFNGSSTSKTFFQIFFKSKIVGKEYLTLLTGSEAVTNTKTLPLKGTFVLEFAKVPECEPDIIPPSINLIYPKDSDQRIALDQYFIFDIKDIGKGVDKTSVIINFQGEQYTYGSEYLKRNGNYLTFSPKHWIPIDTPLDLSILVSDQQSYGGANKTQTTYTFTSATGMMLTKNISPILFRKIAQEAEKVSASIDECALLSDLYIKSDIRYQGEISSIMKKLGCDLSFTSSSLKPIPQSSSLTKEQQQYRNLSVFATLGRILFFITFALKLHYLISYKKHKTLSHIKNNN